MSHNESMDKRRYIRYEVLDYASVVGSGADGFNAVIVDIGLGGLQLRTRAPLAPGQELRIRVGRIDLPPLTLRAEVRHCAVIPNSALCSIGVRFTPDTHEERMAIAEYVHGVFQRQCDLLTY